MIISELINILNSIKEDIGDIDVQIYYDPDQTENLNNKYRSFATDEIKIVKLGNDNNTAFLSNEFHLGGEYEGFNYDIIYNPEDKLYHGKIIPPPHEFIENFDLTFVCKNKYQIKRYVEEMVIKYKIIMCSNKIDNTYNRINIIKDNMNLDKKD